MNERVAMTRPAPISPASRARAGMGCQRPWRGATVVLACAILAITWAAGAAAQGPIPSEEIRAAAQAELSSRLYQRELAIEENRPRSDPPDLPSDLLEVIGWITIAAIGVVALIWLWRFVADRRPRADESEPQAAPEPAAARRTIADYLAEADRLAREGRHVAAARHLLAGAVFGLDGIDSTIAAPSFTAREVLARAPLSGRARPAFGELVASVERAHFAGHELGQSEFANCRESFTHIAAALAANRAP